MRNQDIGQAFKACGAGAVFLLWTGCVSVERGTETLEDIVVSAIPRAAGVAMDATNRPPAGGYAWDTLARMAAANCSAAKALLLEAQAERYQTAVDAGWRNPQLRVGHAWGDENEFSPGRTGLRTYPDEVNQPTRPFTKYRETEDRTFASDSVGLRVYTVNPFVNRWLRKRGSATARALEAQSKEEAYAVFCEVRTLCLEADLLREEIALLEQMAEVRVQIRDVRNEQANAGVTSPLDLIREETRLASLRCEIRERGNARQRLVRRIAVLAGIPVEQVKLCSREPAKPVAETCLDPAVLSDLAFMRRPDLMRLEREKEAAEHGVKAARAGQLPWFEYVEGSYSEEDGSTYQYEEYDSGHDYTSRNQTEWQIRIAVTIPVFNWLGDEVKLSRTQLAAAETRVQGLYETIRAEIDGVLEDYRSALGERNRLADECERLCRTMTARINALAREPAIKREDVLAAHEELIAYRRVCLRAEREWLLMTQYLETVSGGPLAE